MYTVLLAVWALDMLSFTNRPVRLCKMTACQTMQNQPSCIISISNQHSNHSLWKDIIVKLTQRASIGSLVSWVFIVQHHAPMCTPLPHTRVCTPSVAARLYYHSAAPLCLVTMDGVRGGPSISDDQESRILTIGKRTSSHYLILHRSRCQWCGDWWRCGLWVGLNDNDLFFLV